VFQDKKAQRAIQRWLIPSRDGRRRKGWFDVHAWPVLDSRGEVEKVCQVARDVSPSYATLLGSRRLLNARSPDEVYDILISAIEEMGFARGRFYLCEDPESDMDCDLVSAKCFGHDQAFAEGFQRGGRRLSGAHEDYWYKPARTFGTGVVCVRAGKYQVQEPRQRGDLPYVHVPPDYEQDPELAESRDVRVQTALVAQEWCFGQVTVDMGEGGPRVPEHLVHRLFGLAGMAAQTLAAIEIRKRTELMLSGFRHSIAMPVGKYDAMIDTCMNADNATSRLYAGRLAKSAIDELSLLSENLTTQLGTDPAYRGGFRPVDQDIVGHVQTVVDSFKDTYQDYLVRIEYSGPEYAVARVNDKALRLILRNLLANAVKAIQASAFARERRIIVRVVAADDARARRLEVQDNGMGVPKELGRSIYRPLVSGFKSTGIGLPASRYFARLMNATLDHENLPNSGGALFYVEFATGESRDTAKTGSDTGR
jgi:hypothetical protein